MDDNQIPESGTEEPKEGIQYYWCVNCGYNGNFGRRRVRGLQCEECDYDHLTPYELDEIMEDEHLKFKFRNVLK